MKRGGLQQAKTTSAVLLGCAHHWILETPKGPVSAGVCKKCGEQKEFRNYLEGTSWDREIPGLKFEIPPAVVEEESPEN